MTFQVLLTTPSKTGFSIGETGGLIARGIFSGFFGDKPSDFLLLDAAKVAAASAVSDTFEFEASDMSDLSRI